MKNMGLVDRLIRVIVAIVIFYVAVTIDMVGYLKIVLAVVGGIMLVTSVTGFCALYKVFGFCSCKKDSCSCSVINKEDKK